MPYAAAGMVSTDEIEGGIEITDEQYVDALQGVIEGRVISVDGGFVVAFPPPPEPEEPPAPVLNAAAVDLERDRRIALGFTWSGKAYQSRQFDLDNIRSMFNAATALIAQGQVDTTYRWFEPDHDFVWIAADNSLTPMTVTDMIDFGMTAAKYGKDCIFAASAIKNTEGGIPANYATDPRWPAHANTGE